MSGPKHALVMGATGLIGWGVVNELLSADCIAPAAFGRVTALVNRPIEKDQMFWPGVHPRQPKLLLVDGVNLMDGEQKTIQLLRDRIPDADTITHVFYFGKYFFNSKKRSSKKKTDTWYAQCFAPMTAPSRKSPSMSPCSRLFSIQSSL